MHISANDPARKSFVHVPENSDFPIQNLPFGIFHTANNTTPRVGVALGESVIDLAALAALGYFNDLGLDLAVFTSETLNAMMRYGKSGTRAIRNRLADLFDAANQDLQGNKEHVEQVVLSQADCVMHLPVQIGDYTDFYSSREHATNVGSLFRDPANALFPNWLHLPVGYHGRSSSIIISGTPIHRPKGQQKPDDADPVFGPSKLVDFELEMGFFTYEGKPMGESITTEEAEDYIFGMCLFNDWSARDIQKWEYVPLGPFLAKNFASTMSPWIVTLDALEPFKVASPEQDPTPLDYLKFEGDKSYDINISMSIAPENGEDTVVCNSNFKFMYWTMVQQLAHHTVNGCNVRSGDLMASGTISGPTEDSYGSMLELTWRGSKPLTMKDGTERKFIQDNDTVTMRGYAEKDGIRVGFGEAAGKILPAK